MEIFVRFILTFIAAGFFFILPANAKMAVASKDLLQGQSLAIAQVFNRFGCQGGNISPELTWSGVPKETKSFAIMAFDPDAPTGSGWWHWVVFNIPASATGISTGASHNGGLPRGAIQGHTDFGTPGYDGACPPVGHGVHRYQFTVYALSVANLAAGDSLLDANTPAAMVSFIIHANELDHATIEVTYKR